MASAVFRGGMEKRPLASGSPAVRSASERFISSSPGKIAPPANVPSPLRTSAVVAVPAVTTRHGPRRIDQAPINAALAPLRFHPGRDERSAGKKRLEPLARGPARDVGDDDLVRRRDSLPALREAGELGDGHRAAAAPAAVPVQPPFQPRIAAVDGEDHRALSDSSPL